LGPKILSIRGHSSTENNVPYHFFHQPLESPAIDLRTPNQPSDGSNGCCATCLISRHSLFLYRCRLCLPAITSATADLAKILWTRFEGRTKREKKKPASELESRNFRRSPTAKEFSRVSECSSSPVSALQPYAA